MAQYIDRDVLIMEIEKLKTGALQKKNQCKRKGLEKIMHQINAYNKVLSFIDTLEVKETQEDDSIWHDIEELPRYNQNGITDLIVDSYYGHIGREAHYYNSEQWSAHLDFVKNREFKWAYEKDLINF